MTSINSSFGPDEFQRFVPAISAMHNRYMVLNETPAARADEALLTEFTDVVDRLADEGKFDGPARLDMVQNWLFQISQKSERPYGVASDRLRAARRRAFNS